MKTTKKKDHRVQIRLSTRSKQLLAELSDLLEVSESGVIREAILHFYLSKRETYQSLPGNYFSSADDKDL